MNITMAVQTITERRLLEHPLPPESQERINKNPVETAVETIIRIHEKLDILNTLGIDFFDTCVALSLHNTDDLPRFIQLVLKDKQ